MGGSNSSMDGSEYGEHRINRKNYEPAGFGNLRMRVPEDSVQRVHVFQSYAESPKDYERRYGSFGRQNSRGRNETLQSPRMYKEKTKDYGPKTFASLKRRTPADTDNRRNLSKPQAPPERIIGFVMPTEERTGRKQNAAQDRRMPTVSRVPAVFPTGSSTLVEPEPAYMPEVEMASEVREEQKEEDLVDKEEEGERTSKGKRILSAFAPIVGGALVAEVAESIGGPVLGGGTAVIEPSMLMGENLNSLDYGWLVSNASQKEGDSYEDNEPHQTHGEEKLAETDHLTEGADFTHRLSTVPESEEEVVERGDESQILEEQQEGQLQEGETTEDSVAKVSEDGTVEDQARELVAEEVGTEDRGEQKSLNDLTGEHETAEEQADEAETREQEQEGPSEEPTVEPTEVEPNEEIPAEGQTEEQAEQEATEEQETEHPEGGEQYEKQAEETPKVEEIEEITEQYTTEEVIEETATEEPEKEHHEESEQYEEQTVETTEAEPAEQEVAEEQVEQTEQPQEELESQLTESEN
ncbi:unnamed protein product [Calicophoron daubneyi]|uniref:Uncharacterized protein n=1 Tax=Calicophoron daubneyi TaxID=300641 RepID=A0AAV2TPZ0_CALDB